MGGGGGGTLGFFVGECPAGTLESLIYTRASSAEFCYPILGLTPCLSRRRLNEKWQACMYALSRAINCLILTSIKTTDFRLNPNF